MSLRECSAQYALQCRYGEHRLRRAGRFAGIGAIDYAKRDNFGGVSLGRDGKTTVSVRRLDAVLDYPSLRMIKIDVEGMEIEVLRGAERIIEKHKPSLYVENDRTQLSEALISLLFKLGYRLWWHMPRLFNPDNFFGNNENRYSRIASFNMIGLHRSAKSAIRGFQEITDPAAHLLKKARD